MGAALLLALALAGGGRFERTNSRTEQGRSDRGLMSSSGALFEFAPLSGAGMGTACACAAVTGAKGEALTFSRASVGSCIKGSTTSLANGDMVICASGQPRVMPGGDGTGGLGLLVEGAGTNVVTRSEAFDNAAFADYTAGGAAAPTVTADSAASPTGTTTADTLTLPGTGFSESSGRSIAVLTAAAYSAQVYVRGITGPGDIDLCIEQTVGATCSTCTYTTSGWTPCVVQNVTSVAGGMVLVGHLGSLSGVEHLVSASVLVWGLDAKLGSVATSYVPTAGSAVARARDAASFAQSMLAPAGICMAADLTIPATSVLVGGSGLYAPGLSAAAGSFASPYVWPYTAGTGSNLSVDGAGSASGGYVSATAPLVSARYVVRHDGSAWTICRNSTCTTGIATTWLAPTFAHIKLEQTTTVSQLWKAVQVDPDPTRCR